MKIVKPSIEFVEEKNLVKKLRMAYAVCYKNEASVNWDKMAEWIQSKARIGHCSPLEHVRIKVPLEEYNELLQKRRNAKITEAPYGFQSRINIHLWANPRNVEMNVRDWVAIGGKIENLREYREATDYATVKIICDRGVSHEFVRHRSLSFTQESTRYCNYCGDVMFINLFSAFQSTGFNGFLKRMIFSGACRFAELFYSALIHLGANPQEARAVLPNGVKTEIWITGTFNEWKAFFKLRCGKGAHPQARQICELILNNKNCPKQMRP